jgi:hypothetical protein
MLDEFLSSSEYMFVDSWLDNALSSEHLSASHINVSDFIIFNYCHGMQKQNVYVLIVLMLPKSVDGHGQR